jgi:hypothetical protein
LSPPEWLFAFLIGLRAGYSDVTQLIIRQGGQSDPRAMIATPFA